MAILKNSQLSRTSLRFSCSLGQPSPQDSINPALSPSSSILYPTTRYLEVMHPSRARQEDYNNSGSQPVRDRYQL
ncbi:hypothetical protein Y032_0033g2774 [Ancylostoma ceylanicum]|uniref:Uncharacterized protein n=1 Tax=Ancylostoma ceylanicum TaxID=53326 RepID=A0A016UP78_9BILA|nr:hypothetical protein Y032_0033g2774 [Ancylostoma ceylanicum]